MQTPQDLGLPTQPRRTARTPTADVLAILIAAGGFWLKVQVPGFADWTLLALLALAASLALGVRLDFQKFLRGRGD